MSKQDRGTQPPQPNPNKGKEEQKGYQPKENPSSPPPRPNPSREKK